MKEKVKKDKTDKKDISNKDVYTTYDAARICKANIASIKNWITKGLVKAFRTPGGHYRIKRRDLELFVSKYNMPFSFAKSGPKDVFVVLCSQAFGKAVAKAAPGYQITVFDDVLKAAMAIGTKCPDVVLLAYPGNNDEGKKLLTSISSNVETRNARMILVVDGLTTEQEAELRKQANVDDLVGASTGVAGLTSLFAHLF